MRRLWLLALCLLLTGCNPPAPVAMAVDTPTWQPPEDMICVTMTPTATSTPTSTPTVTPTFTPTPVPTPTLDRNVLPPGVRVYIVNADGSFLANQWVDLVPDGWLPEGQVFIWLEAFDGVALAGGPIPVTQRR
jgi:hypothetical protein